MLLKLCLLAQHITMCHVMFLLAMIFKDAFHRALSGSRNQRGWHLQHAAQPVSTPLGATKWVQSACLISQLNLHTSITQSLSKFLMHWTEGARCLGFVPSLFGSYWIALMLHTGCIWLYRTWAHNNIVIDTNLACISKPSKTLRRHACFACHLILWRYADYSFHQTGPPVINHPATSPIGKQKSNLTSDCYCSTAIL